MRYQREGERRTEEPTGRDWPILLFILGAGLMLWAPVLMLFMRRG